MTLADRLRQQAAALHQQAAALIELAAALDRAAPMPAPGREFFLDTHRAMKISRRSSSWLYKNACKHGFGWKLESGAWAYSKERLVCFLAGRTSVCEENDELCEENDGHLFRRNRKFGMVEMIRDGKGNLKNG